MTLSIRRLLATFTLSFAVAAWGDDDDCRNDDWPEGSAMHTGCIAKQAFSEADRELNAVYKKLLANLPADEPDNYPKKALIEAQRAWIKYRDAVCVFEAEATGAVRMWKSTNFIDCQARLTRQRTEELKDQLGS